MSEELEELDWSLGGLAERSSVDEMATWLIMSLARNTAFPVVFPYGDSALSNEYITAINKLTGDVREKMLQSIVVALGYHQNVTDNLSKYNVFSELVYIAGRTGAAKLAQVSIQEMIAQYGSREAEEGIGDLVATATAILRGLSGESGSESKRMEEGVGND